MQVSMEMGGHRSKSASVLHTEYTVTYNKSCLAGNKLTPTGNKIGSARTKIKLARRIFVESGLSTPVRTPIGGLRRPRAASRRLTSFIIKLPGRFLANIFYFLPAAAANGLHTVQLTYSVNPTVSQSSSSIGQGRCTHHPPHHHHHSKLPRPQPHMLHTFCPIARFP